MDRRTRRRAILAAVFLLALWAVQIHNHIHGLHQ